MRRRAEKEFFQERRVDDCPLAVAKAGKWIPSYNYAKYCLDGTTPLPQPIKFQDGWKCSLCDEWMPGKTNFCPNCGAEMREIIEGEEE